MARSFVREVADRIWMAVLLQPAHDHLGESGRGPHLVVPARDQEHRAIDLLDGNRRPADRLFGLLGGVIPFPERHRFLRHEVSKSLRGWLERREGQAGAVPTCVKRRNPCSPLPAEGQPLSRRPRFPLSERPASRTWVCPASGWSGGSPRCPRPASRGTRCRRRATRLTA